jgi:hypothetical protein
VAAALAAATVGLVATNASALPAGSASAGTPVLAPTTGTVSTTFNLTTPVGAACQGDSASGGYKVGSFIVPSTQDPATLTYTASGPNVGTPIYDTTGSPFIAKNTAVTTGFLTGLPNINLTTATPAAGKYWIGYACYLAGATTRFWANNITVDAAGGFALGWSPNAPVLGALTPHTGQLVGTFTVTQVNPAITGYTVTAQPQPSGTPVTLALAAAATGFTLTGLTDGTAYSVTVTAANGVTPNAVSNAVLGTPGPDACPAPGAFTALGAAQAINLSWGTPTCAISGNPAITSYTVTYQDTTAATAAVTLAPAPTAAATSASIPGLVSGHQYTVTLKANYSGLFTGTLASVSNIAPLSNVILIQDVQATRPGGALVMTQVCGSWGTIPAIAANAFFPVDLPAVTPSNGGSQQIDALGNATGAQNANPRIADNVTLDSNFAAYPYPVDTNPASPTYGQPIAVYPTHCGLNLGTAKLITNTGYGVQGLSGQYFQTAGQLNQVTVVNTDEQDKGWTVKGSLTNFVKSGFTEAAANPTQKFSSNHFGWNPVLTAASGNAYGEYAIAASQGGAVDPLSGGAGAAGAFSQKTLGSAAARSDLPAPGTVTAWGNQATGSLGIAKFDARVKLLIPVWAVSGTYTATLTLSAV